MPGSSKSKMLQNLVGDILEETLGEEEQESKETVKKAVRNIINEIYGEDEFTDKEIDASVDKYFNTIEKKEETRYEEIYDILGEIEKENKSKETAEINLDIGEELNLDFSEFQNDMEKIDLDFSEFQNDMGEIGLDFPSSENEDTANKSAHIKEKITEEKSGTIEDEITDLNIKNNQGESFYEYISSIRDNILNLWEDDHPDMERKFKKARVSLETILETLNNDCNKHKKIEAQAKGDLKEINQQFLKMFKTFRIGTEELIKFIDTEDPTFIFSSKKQTQKGDKTGKEIGKKLSDLN